MNAMPAHGAQRLFMARTVAKEQRNVGCITKDAKTK
jgi:hypothetical protein